MRSPGIQVNLSRMSIAAALAILFSVPPLPQPSAEGRAIHQVRRVSRRTSRRTTRRVVRRHQAVIAPGHTTVIHAGTTYHVSGGVHYVQRMVGGRVVYVRVAR